MKIVTEAWDYPDAPSGVEKLSYKSDQDGMKDWALARRPDKGSTWVVHLHGHGSSGDQIYTRADIRDLWLSHYLRLGFGVLSPNLRGNAWMCPEAVVDLHLLLDVTRREYGGRTFYFVSGSMGGTGNLMYATAHPEDVALLVALCPVTDIASYHEWCRSYPGGVRDEIRAAIESAYGGSPDQVPKRYAGHCAIRHADRLTMPLLLAHATGDATIPVEQSRRLRQRLSSASNMTYVEIEGGNHDSPLHGSGMLKWLDQNFQRK
ncbi:MAG: prolyl oligopeptidase family serine peptidase [Gemmatimonadetes bacterium]|jgi:pimeloyl-ACP methyl ester carboxylesterase|nr:prolyl oligopeptidase family serine peptidase [Gemmatimonadota bacterium]